MLRDVIKGLLREQQEDQKTAKEQFQSSNTLRELGRKAKKGIIIDGYRFHASIKFDVASYPVMMVITGNDRASMRWTEAREKVVEIGLDRFSNDNKSAPTTSGRYGYHKGYIAYYFNSLDQWEEAVRVFLAADGKSEAQKIANAMSPNLISAFVELNMEEMLASEWDALKALGLVWEADEWDEDIVARPSFPLGEEVLKVLKGRSA